MNRNVVLRRRLGTAFALGLIAGCGNASKNEGQSASSEARRRIVGGAHRHAGATFPYPIYSKWFDVYHKKTGVEINYQSIGSGAGIQQVKAGTVDFGASDAALSNAAAQGNAARGAPLPDRRRARWRSRTTCPASTQPLKLTPDIVAGIYLGKITPWNDQTIAAANPGVDPPAAPILAVHRSDGSGTTNIFTTYLSRGERASGRSWSAPNTSVSWPVGRRRQGQRGRGRAGPPDARARSATSSWPTPSRTIVAGGAAAQPRDGQFVEPSARLDHRRDRGARSTR